MTRIKGRRLQIGVIGSCSDIESSKQAESFAASVGKLIAKADHTLIFGVEKDVSSLPTVAAKAARIAGGEVVGMTYEKGLEIFSEDSATIVVSTGLVRGGGRETALMLSCDVVIAIAGGSGTLTELAIAYQARVPVVTVTGFGGWSEKLSGTYLDERKRFKFIQATTPEEAFERAVNAVK